MVNADRRVSSHCEAPIADMVIRHVLGVHTYISVYVKYALVHEVRRSGLVTWFGDAPSNSHSPSVVFVLFFG